MAKAFLLDLEEVAQRLRRRYRNSRGKWLVGEGEWPLSMPLGVPRNEQQVLDHLAEVRRWQANWQGAAGDFEIVWEPRKWRQVGTQNLPVQIRFASPEAVVDYIGDGEAWRRAKRRYREVTSHWPVLAGILPSDFPVLSEWSDDEFSRLISLLQWFDSHPDSGLYIRQVPIAGMDSKWLESHRGIVQILLRTIRDQSGCNDFYALTGLRPLPTSMRMRILDPGLRSCFDGIGDVTAPIDHLADIAAPIHTVFIVENLQTGLAFEDFKGAVVIMGQGYAVEPYSCLPWLAHCRCFYWGDLDTHGFAILDKLRKHVPHVNSLLMDEKTLLAFRNLWGDEEKPCAVKSHSRLDENEIEVYRKLKQHYWGPRVRLEQERIPWDYAWSKVKEQCAGIDHFEPGSHIEDC